jgi:ABC-type sulfate/molybdate transport systems ATPase subunit
VPEPPAPMPPVPDPGLEFDIDARRGGFHLQVAGRFTSTWTVVFGPSGAGKSTLLRLLAGLGDGKLVRVTLEGRILSDSSRGFAARPGKRQTGLVAQEPALFPHLTVAENVGYGLEAMDRVQRAHRVEEMLTLAGAAELAGRRPQDLSGGQAQHVALARALAPAPLLLLLDEPFSALDGATSDALLERLQAWVAAIRVQVVLATHDATDALALGAEVLLLEAGQKVAQGPAAVVLAAERERLRNRLDGQNHPPRSSRA